MKILLVGEVSSPHTANWVQQLKNTDWDVHIFQALSPGNGIHTGLSEFTVYYPSEVPNKSSWIINTLGFWDSVFVVIRVLKINRIPFIYKWVNTKSTSLHFKFLYKLIINFKPDIIHSHGMNINWRNLLLPVYDIKRNIPAVNFPKWLYSTWGTDLDYFAKMNDTILAQVKAILPCCDYLTTECKRDERLAFEYGFQGTFLGYLPDYGGVKLKEILKYRNTDKASSRKSILLKGRDSSDGTDPIGKALTALDAFEICREFLIDIPIYIFQASACVVKKAEFLKEKYNLQIVILDYLPYNELLKIFGMSRIFISITINDGLPSTLLESMSLGAFPVYSNLEPIAEWVDHGVNGFLVPYDNPNTLAKVLQIALENNQLIDSASVKNLKIIEDHFSEDVVRPRIIDMYKQIYTLSHQRK